MKDSLFHSILSILVLVGICFGSNLMEVNARMTAPTTVQDSSTGDASLSFPAADEESMSTYQISELVGMVGSLTESQVITLTNTGFTPQAITVSVGSVVTWYNATNQTHILRSGVPNALYLPVIFRGSGNSGVLAASHGEQVILENAPVDDDFIATLAPGEIFTHTFPTTGAFPFFLVTRPQYRGQVEVQYGLGAPPIDPTIPTDFAASIAFLYTGDDPIQTGVISGTISSQRVAVLRGLVLDRDGIALPGVTVSVLDHTEYGQTLSRADGMFDLAVNGGGMLTVNYVKEGFLPLQRKIDAPWREFAWLPEVSLIPLDAHVTAVDLTLPTIQVAQGSLITDADGERQATLLVPPGTQAMLIFSGGVTQTLTSFHARLTEYTVGDSGPQAMPGEMPAQIGYTYAVEYSVDEALAAGALNVSFSQPLIHYSQNFLNFPAGMDVPVGYYDRVNGQWVAAPNGRVIQIMSIHDGRAELDTDGDGVVDNGASLGVTDTERQTLANLYTTGQTLWRVPVSHFSPWDCNWPFGLPDGATDPQQPSPRQSDRTPVDDDCPEGGSIIGCETQQLIEHAEIAGTPFRLAYASQRVAGRKDAYQLIIPLSGATIPDSLAGIELVVQVAGREFYAHYSPAANRSIVFIWDGQDAYGRTPQGEQPVTVKIGYVYQAVYRTPAENDAAFGLYGDAIANVRSRQEIIIWQTWLGTLGTWRPANIGRRGWELDVHHSYGLGSRVLYLGDGNQRSSEALSLEVIHTTAGNGDTYYNGDGIPATQASLLQPLGIALGPDGSQYIADWGHMRVRRVGSDGMITTVAGTGYACAIEDGIPAAQACIEPYDVALGPDGSVYIVDNLHYRIRRVGPDGIITTVAGNGDTSFNGDGIPATQAALMLPHEIALGQDGSLYITEFARIRRVGPDGIINTVAGDGNAGYNGDGIPATQATLNNPWGVALGPDGSLYIADSGNHRIRRVGPDGIITTVAGNGIVGYNGDGMPATQAYLNFPFSVALGPDGSLFIADRSNSRVRSVLTDGNIVTVAGNGAMVYNGEELPAAQAAVGSPTEVASAPDGSLYYSDYYNNRVRRVTSTLPGWTPGELLIPAEDGSEVYRFDAAGRHLETLEALTGALRYQFGYDSSGRLVSVTDGSGNLTTIERDADGNPTGIVSPYGQRTSLESNSNGDLARILSPAGESLQFEYTDDGLLTQLTDPRGGIYRYTYDDLGRLARHEDPSGGFKAFSRVESSAGMTVTVTTAEGRSTIYGLARLPTGGAQRTVVEPGGATTVAVFGADGTRQITYPDGTRLNIIFGPDPRWGMLAPLETSLTATLPDGAQAMRSLQRSANLVDEHNPFSLIDMTDQVTIDGHAYTSMYTVDPHTIAYTSPEGRQAIATLDERGRVISFARDGLDTITFSYDGRGRLATAAQGARSFDYIYDATGMAASVTDAAGRQTHYAYTPSNHLAQTTLPGGELFTFGYDADGNLAEVIPPLGANHAMTYTPVDRLASYTPPDGITAAWSYNADHELTGASLPGDIQEVYGLDGAGRIEEFSYPGTTVSFAYSDQTDRIAEITRIAVVGTQSIGFTYNGASLISANWSGVANGAYTYTYGSDLQLNNITLDGGSQIALSRDADGLLTSYGPITFIRAGPGGDPTQISSGPLDIVYAYNPLAEFSERSITVSGQALYREQMTFDESGRLTQKIDTWLGDQRNYSYTYDADGQLLSIMLDGDTSEQYGYDANGNRTSRKLETSPLETATYDSQDRIVQQGALNYQFDAAGFLTGRGSDTFTYSTRGELVQARVGGQTINYAYDGFGRRVSRADSAGVYQYLYGNPDNPFQLTAARDPSGVLSEFYYDEGSRLLAIQRAGIWYYAASDFLGTPRVIADSSGSVVKSLAFDGFGRQVSDSNPGFILPVGFAGGLADMATGLVRFGLRDYDPEAGRWTARDPVLFDGRQSNLYVYASNNPVQLADPLGLFSFGMSAYEGVGGGFSVSFTSVGFSWCGELGLGIGKSVGVDPFGDLEEAGGSLNLELGGSVGFLSGSLGYSEKTKGGGLSGCPGKFSPEFCAGPFCTSGNNLKVSGDPGNRKSSISDLFKATGVDMQAKMTYKHCAQFKW